MMVRPSIILDENTLDTATPATRSLKRGGLMMAVLEAMAKPLVQRQAEKAPAPALERKPVNRHERRKASALARRGLR